MGFAVGLGAFLMTIFLSFCILSSEVSSLLELGMAVTGAFSLVPLLDRRFASCLATFSASASFFHCCHISSTLVGIAGVPTLGRAGDGGGGGKGCLGWSLDATLLRGFIGAAVAGGGDGFGSTIALARGALGLS